MSPSKHKKSYHFYWCMWPKGRFLFLYHSCPFFVAFIPYKPPNAGISFLVFTDDMQRKYLLFHEWTFWGYPKDGHKPDKCGSNVVQIMVDPQTKPWTRINYKDFILTESVHDDAVHHHPWHARDTKLTGDFWQTVLYLPSKDLWGLDYGTPKADDPILHCF